MPTLTEAQQNALANLMRITPVAGELTQRFRDAGHQLYLVGGSVRDALLGRLGNDLDFTTDARPDEIERILSEFTKTTWDVGRQFGTIGARKRTKADDSEADWLIEITTFRADSYASESRKPEVRFGDTLDGDLGRRDFTVNAMALDVLDKQFHDPFDGLTDLTEQRLRACGGPEQSFSDDPLRMMRAARFTSQLNFTPTPDVANAMSEMADRLDIVSPERIRDELNRLLLTPNPVPGLQLLVNTGLTDRFFPELSRLKLERDEHNRHKDVYAHTLIVLSQSIDLEQARGHEPDLIGRLAAIFHDIGKPATRRFEEGGKVTFHHHDVVGAKITRKRMRALHYSKDEIAAVAHLVELHQPAQGRPAGAQLRRFGDTNCGACRGRRTGSDPARSRRQPDHEAVRPAARARCRARLQVAA